MRNIKNGVANSFQILDEDILTNNCRNLFSEYLVGF